MSGKSHRERTTSCDPPPTEGRASSDADDKHYLDSAFSEDWRLRRSRRAIELLCEEKSNTKADARVREWTSCLNFSSDEILPGWFMDYEVKPGNTGYILILTGSDEEQKTESDEKRKSVWVTDEEVLIYRATPYATDRLPTAREITRAQDFPGAKPL